MQGRGCETFCRPRKGPMLIISTFVPQDDQYLVPKRSYETQYSSYYFSRFTAMTPIVKDKATALWPNIPSAPFIMHGLYRWINPPLHHLHSSKCVMHSCSGQGARGGRLVRGTVGHRHWHCLQGDEAQTQHHGRIRQGQVRKDCSVVIHSFGIGLVHGMLIPASFLLMAHCLHNRWCMSNCHHLNASLGWGTKHVLGAPLPVCFCGDGDFVVLEDDGGRMVIRGDCLPVHELVTGETCVIEDGRFRAPGPRRSEAKQYLDQSFGCFIIDK